MNTKSAISARFIEAYELLRNAGEVNDKRDFALRAGISPSLMTEIYKGRSNVGMQAVQSIVELYGISAHWLLTGEGTPRDSAPAAAPVMSPDSAGIPLIPTDAMAGFFAGAAEVMDYECERYSVPMLREADFLIPVRGNSMEPRYRSGDIVACRFLPLGDVFFQWGKPYVLDTEQGTLLKRVCQGSAPDTVTLVSENESYQPFEIPRASIRHLALVLGFVRPE